MPVIEKTCSACYADGMLARTLGRCLLLFLIALVPFAVLRSQAHRDATPRLGPMAKQGGAMDWPLFGNARDNTRYSPSGAINPATVARLRLAWRRDEGFGQLTWESFPLVVGGRMYLTTDTGRGVVPRRRHGPRPLDLRPAGRLSVLALRTGIGHPDQPGRGRGRRTCLPAHVRLPPPGPRRSQRHTAVAGAGRRPASRLL